MIFRYIFICSILAYLSSCASIVSDNSLAGIYKVISRTCVGGQYQKDACKEIKLLEIVKGNFYKIRDHENAFVVWSGESDLIYNARKLDKKIEKITYPAEITINSDNVYFEKIIFTSSTGGKYVFGKVDNLSTLIFGRISENDLAGYSKEYPGNKLLQ